MTDAEKVYRSEEHTSELQSRSDLVCRLLLEKKKKGARARGLDPFQTSGGTTTMPLDIGDTLFRNLVVFFNDPATTEIYTLSLHDALPIWLGCRSCGPCWTRCPVGPRGPAAAPARSEEHTSELQSRSELVCRLLLEKK